MTTEPATVLLAEREASAAGIVRTVLAENGYKVVATTDGKEALRWAAMYRDKLTLLS